MWYSLHRVFFGSVVYANVDNATFKWSKKCFDWSTFFTYLSALFTNNLITWYFTTDLVEEKNALNTSKMQHLNDVNCFFDRWTFCTYLSAIFIYDFITRMFSMFQEANAKVISVISKTSELFHHLFCGVATNFLECNNRVLQSCTWRNILKYFGLVIAYWQIYCKFSVPAFFIYSI